MILILKGKLVSLLFLKGFVFFFFLERLIVWRKCLSFSLMFLRSSYFDDLDQRRDVFLLLRCTVSIVGENLFSFSLCWFLRIFLFDGLCHKKKGFLSSFEGKGCFLDIISSCPCSRCCLFSSLSNPTACLVIYSVVLPWKVVVLFRCFR